MGFSDKVAIAICGRCNFKYKISTLVADGNIPALRVCEDCRDPKDPWRLRPISPDAIAVKKPRPDISIGLNAPPAGIKWGTQGLEWGSGLKWGQTT